MSTEAEDYERRKLNRDRAIDEAFASFNPHARVLAAIAFSLGEIADALWHEGEGIATRLSGIERNGWMLEDEDGVSVGQRVTGMGAELGRVASALRDIARAMP